MAASLYFAHKIWATGFLAALAVATSRYAAAESIRIDDELRHPFEQLYSEPLQGFRAFPIELFAADLRKGGAATIASDVFFEAIQKSDVLKEKMREAGVDPASATWEQVALTLKNLEAHAIAPLSEERVYVFQSLDDYASQLTPDKHLLLRSLSYDPNFLINIIRTEAVHDFSRRAEWRGLPVRQTRQVQLDQEFAFDVFEAYGSLRTLSQLQPQLVSSQFEGINVSLSKYPEFANLAKYALGYVSVGRPIILTSTESDLDIPQTLREIFDFFVILLAVTVRDDLDFVEAITFSVSLPQECSVFDLFPLRYGVEAKVTEGYSAPGLSVEAGGVKVAFSSIFKQTLEYNQLRPTVVGYGLQEAEFGWAFRDDAAGLGSHRVAAVIGVPKKFGDVPYTTSIFVKGKDSFLTEGDIASSKPRTFILLSN